MLLKLQDCLKIYSNYSFLYACAAMHCSVAAWEKEGQNPQSNPQSSSRINSYRVAFRKGMVLHSRVLTGLQSVLERHVPVLV